MVRASELVDQKTYGILIHQDIIIGANKIKINMIQANNDVTMKYQQKGDNCNLVYNGTLSTVQNSNFVSIFCEDFYKILLEQYINLTFLTIIPDFEYVCPDDISSKILDSITTSLSLKSEKIDVTFIIIEIFGFEQVMDILSYVNPISLSKLTLKFPVSCSQDDIEEVLALERWSAFKHLELDMYWHTVSAKEIMCIKKTLTTSRIFDSIHIHYAQIDEEKVMKVLGHSWREFNRGVHHYIRVPNSTNQVLRTTMYTDAWFNDSQSLLVKRVSDKNIYDSLPASDEGLIPCEVNNDWSKTLENKTIIELLLDHLGFIEIQTLRKVCSNIRTCIDHYKPNPNLTKLGIGIGRNISILMGFKNGSSVETDYVEEKSGCQVGRTLVKQEVYQTCLDDLKSILPGKEMNLEEFEFAFNCDSDEKETDVFRRTAWFMERVEELLTPNNVLMKVERYIHSAVDEQHHGILESIKWLEPISLECIQTQADGECEWHMNEAMKLIMNTNQWQYAKEYVNKEFAFLGRVNPILFVHFSKIDIIVKNWTNEDFFNWKEEILYSPSFIKYKISFENCYIYNDIYNVLGLPYRTVNGRTTWYFKMPEKNLVLHVIYYTSKAVIFTRVDIEDVPEVVVMNFDVQLID